MQCHWHLGIDTPPEINRYMVLSAASLRFQLIPFHTPLTHEGEASRTLLRLLINPVSFNPPSPRFYRGFGGREGLV